MLIYEKDNKLNINFENSVNESPDLQIGKSGDKTEVLIDGQPGGGVGVLICTDTNDALDKTMGEIQEAFLHNDRIELQVGGGVSHSIAVYLSKVHLNEKTGTYYGGVSFAFDNNITFYHVSKATEAEALAAYPFAS